MCEEMDVAMCHSWCEISIEYSNNILPVYSVWRSLHVLEMKITEAKRKESES